MRYFDARVIENRSLGGGYFVFRLGGCEPLAESRPGQFVMLRGDWGRDPLLPRPLSLLSVAHEGRADLLAKVVGKGTALMERSPPGSRVSVLGPLGNSFPMPSSEVTDLFVAGGVGLPPLFMQAESAARLGLAGGSEMLYGGRTSRDLVLLGEIRAMGIPLHLATEDGSLGRRGRVTDELEARIEYWRVATSSRRLRIMACGPRGMLWAVGRIAQSCDVECYLSLEEQMACGIGVCLGCAVAARTRPYRYVCKDGPVFPACEVMAHAPAEPTSQYKEGQP
jgi:dihydroorotate dehydrogenase electron transfer subunit